MADHLAAASRALFAGDIPACLAALDALPQQQRDRAWRKLRGVALAMQGHFAAAIPLYEDLLEADPYDLEVRLNLGAIQRDAGLLEPSLATLSMATQQAPAQGPVWHHLGLTQMALRDWAAASQSLYQAAQRMPDNQSVRILAAQALARSGAAEAARAALDSCATPDSLSAADAWQYVQALLALADSAAATPVLEQLLARNPQAHAVQLQLAALYEKANKVEAAQTQLHALPPAASADPLAGLISARLQRRAGDPNRALQQLPREGIKDPELAVEIQFEKARLLDQLGEYEAAHAAATLANRGAQMLRPGADDAFDTLLASGVTAAEVADWQALPVADPQAQPIFLIGFPRSGTTLLDVLLAGHSGLQVLSESPALEQLVAPAETLGQAPYPAALHGLDETARRTLQLHYFDAASRDLGPRQPGTRLVDKNPLNLLRLPLIARVFPQAPVIYCSRDVRDTAVSCFLHDMGGRGRQGFWSLAESCRLLEGLQTFYTQQSAHLQLRAFPLRYEEWITRPESMLQELCAWLGLRFEASMLHNQHTARERGIINTPSYASVTQPIAATGIGRWQHYAAYF